MSLDQLMMTACVRIIGDWPPNQTVQRRTAIGTGFLMIVESEELGPDVIHGHVLTAHHVLDGQAPGRVQVQAPDPTRRQALHDPIRIDDWVQPIAGLDLAIAPWLPESDPRPFNAGRMDNLTPVSAELAGPALASTVYYVGVLVDLDRIMVRSGTIGALNQWGIPHSDDYDYPCHLFDCRSYGGFSGSPCYVEIPLPSLVEKVPPFPNESSGLPLGTMEYKAVQIGMLTEHLEDKEAEAADGVASRFGIGVMMRGDEIKQALLSEPMKEDRRKRDRDVPPASKAKLTGAGRKEPKRDMDERVSLAPLSAEDALRGLLDTPPLDQDEG